MSPPQGAASCPASAYHPGPGSASIAASYFPQPKMEVDTEEPTEGPRRLAKPPKDSIRPTCKWPGGLNGPVDEIRVWLEMAAQNQFANWITRMAAILQDRPYQDG